MLRFRRFQNMLQLSNSKEVPVFIVNSEEAVYAMDDGASRAEPNVPLDWWPTIYGGI
jgi:hypothetical protein